MNEININGLELEMYVSKEEMPINRTNKYNKYVLLDIASSSDIEDVKGTIQNARSFVGNDDKENADKALVNLWQSIEFIENNVNPKYYSFVACIKSIDGVLLTDISNPQRIVDMLGEKGLTNGIVDKFLSFLKKKGKKKVNFSFRKRQTQEAH